MPGQTVRTPKQKIIAATATAVGHGAYATLGVSVDIESYGNLCLHLVNSGTDAAKVKVFIEDDYSAAQPTASTDMHLLTEKGTAGVITLPAADAQVSYQLPGVSGKYLLVEAIDNGTDASLTAYVTGTIQMT